MIDFNLSLKYKVASYICPKGLFVAFKIFQGLVGTWIELLLQYNAFLHICHLGKA